jgi:DNA-binding HxlR family transcriptional regulator
MMKNKKEIKSNPAIYKLGNREFSCPIELTTNSVNGKWKILILHRLSEKKCLRFSELKKEIENVSEKMLIQHLKELEKDGLVTRKIYPVVPPKVEYSLTEEGKRFVPVIDAMRQFGKGFIK